MSTTLIGQTLLDQYRVDSFIASGSMGAVYKVHDLKRDVPLAMKVLHVELAEDPSVFKRFQREARALQKLAHPNILPFYGVEQTQGFAFILVRFVDGMSLKEIISVRKHQPMDVGDALIYLRALCAALGYAHANQVVHCDVKPGNIMVERGGTIFLSDFGIARHAESNATTLASLGTAAYMAPEQIRGEMVTPATDIYALGVLLFELLTGRRPFRGEGAGGTEKSSGTSNEQIRHLHLNSLPPNPSFLNSKIPPALAQVVLKALAKEPRERFSSTKEMFSAACRAAGVDVDQVAELASPISAAGKRPAETPQAPPAQPGPVSGNTNAVKKIGRYEVLREIGRGGMATVYAAHDPLFNRDVAIKMLPPELLHDPSFRTRFEREAVTVAALEHPAIVPVYDYGEAEGRPYFVMRMMTNDSLAERIANGPMSLATTVKLAQRIASALDEAHTRGVIHRDLKPGNILFDQYNEPYLSDFGIAKLQESGATLTGENIVGTPAYMSPEQGRGEADLDGRSDIYSLGCILYEMLTGKVPYEANTSMGQVVKHLTANVPNIYDLRPDLPGGVQEVISRAMAKRKFARYAKASELTQALAVLVNGIEATPSLRELAETLPNSHTAAAQAKPAQVLQGKQAAQKPPSGSPGAVKSTPAAANGKKPLAGAEKRAAETAAEPARKKSWSWLLWVMVALLLTAAAYSGLSYLPGLLGAGIAPQLPAQTQAVAAGEQATETITPPPANEAPPPASETPLPSATLAASDTPVPSETAEVESPLTSEPLTAVASTGPVIGGADKIAFVKDNDIWIANLDATEIISLTTTGGTKTELQWTPDGENVKFIMGKCALLVNINDKSVSTILCANWADYLGAFEISPDGKQVAITTSDGLFILPYDLDGLRTIRRQDQLLNMQGCLKYTGRTIKTVRWSADGKMLASVMVGSEAGRSVDLVWVAAITCGQPPVDVDQFPGTRFTMAGYSQVPIIESFGWDGDVNFALNVDIRIGYGDLFTYNLANNRGVKNNLLNNGRCCYRDFTWSPDGQYLMFAYLDSNFMDDVQIYYIEYGLIGQGLNYTPIPFAKGFLPADSNASSPQPALRRAP